MASLLWFHQGIAWLAGRTKSAITPYSVNMLVSLPWATGLAWLSLHDLRVLRFFLVYTISLVYGWHWRLYDTCPMAGGKRDFWSGMWSSGRFLSLRRHI